MDIVERTLHGGHTSTPEQIALVLNVLTSDEEKWRDRHPMLKAEGYELRPRLRPGWKPSWIESGKDPFECEDGEILPQRPLLVDAIQEATGKQVYIKEVPSNSEELHIAQMLIQEEWAKDPRNHCVPLIKVFKDHQNSDLSYMVMPFLRPVETPPFETVKEIIRFADQILEGLVFLHEKGVAHRDCVQKNLMMDADAMYPEGFHAVVPGYKADYSGPAEHISRTDAKVKYYFIDFGISVHIPENVQPKLATGSMGRDRDPPELSETVPYDPFKLDIFIIGNMFKREFQEPFSNLDFFGPLVTAMTKQDPSSRPTAEQALALWQGVRKSLSAIHKGWRPRSREEHPIGAFVLDVISLHQFFMHCAKSFAKRVRL